MFSTGKQIKKYLLFQILKKNRILFVLTGNIHEKTWNQEENEYSIYSLKGVINSFLSKISLDNVLNDFYYQEENRIFDLTFSVIRNKVELGQGGRVKKDILGKFDIDQDVYCFWLILMRLDHLKTC
jgi:phenylalanyl-tRNA synthetase beta subunit